MASTTPPEKYSTGREVGARKSDIESPVENQSIENASVQEVTDDLNTFPEGGLRAWLVVAGASAALFSTMGYANAFGVYQEYYQSHQLSHETPSAISWIGSLQLFIMFASSVIAGPLFDMLGHRTIWPSAIAYVFSLMMTSLCKHLWQFILCQGVLGGFSMGMVLGPAMAATGHYFKQKRAAAMGIIVAASSCGGVIFPIALSHMLAHPSLKFAWTVRILAFVILALLSLTCIFTKARLPPRKGRFFLPEAFKDLSYTTMIASIFFLLMGMFIPFFYLPSYAINHGMSTQLASNLVSILNGASFFGRVIPGLIANKVGKYNVLSISGMSTAILIFCWTHTHSNASIIVFSALYGFCSGAIISLMSLAFMSTAKDPKDIGTYYGMGMGVSSIAALIGPPINGALVTKYGSFDQAGIFCGVTVLVGALGVLVSKFCAGKKLLSFE